MVYELIYLTEIIILGYTFLTFLKNNFPELFGQDRKVRRQEKLCMEHGHNSHREDSSINER